MISIRRNNQKKIKLLFPKTKIEPVLDLSEQSKKWLILTLLYSISTHISHLPIWTIILFPILTIWGYNTQIKKRFIPSKKIIGIIVLLTIGGILITYNTYLGKDPGITALVLLTIFKLIELKNYKDYMFIVFLSYFLLFGNFLFNQDIITMLFMIIGLIISTSSILKINYGDSKDIKFSFILKKVISFIILSIPFMIVLFLFFPRFSTSISLLDISDNTNKKGISGFSDFLRPGSLSEIVKSNDPAFRVEFINNKTPEQKDLYFRGNILWETNGKYWRQENRRNRIRPDTEYKNENGIEQMFTLEPHNRHWLFALDYPVDMPRGAIVYSGNVFRTRFRIKKKTNYKVTSVLDIKNKNPKLSYREKFYGLLLPVNWNSKILQLGLKWKNNSISDSEIVATGLEYFKSNGFTYTLEPGIMNEDTPLEDFLFNKRKGFCEHYAATFALLMRSAGVPARIVVGYQGGEFNNVGGYLLVRQSDAHAWTEVWLKEKGWVRIDPTETVSPERILYGADISKIIEFSNLKDPDEILRSLNKINFFKKLSVYFSFYLDNINRKWDQWVIMYSRYSQLNLLEYLGIGYLNRSLLFLILIIAILSILFVLSIFLRKNAYIDPVQKVYFSFFKKIKKSGITPYTWEGPIDFKSRLIKEMPDKREEIDLIIHTYIQLRFGTSLKCNKELYKFKKLVRMF